MYLIRKKRELASIMILLGGYFLIRRIQVPLILSIVHACLMSALLSIVSAREIHDKSARELPRAKLLNQLLQSSQYSLPLEIKSFENPPQTGY